MDEAYHIPTGQVVSGEFSSAECRGKNPAFQDPDAFYCPYPFCRVPLKLINMRKALRPGMMPYTFSARWSPKERHEDACKHALNDDFENDLYQKKSFMHRPGRLLYFLGDITRKKSTKARKADIPNLPESTRTSPSLDLQPRRAHRPLLDYIWLPNSRLSEILQVPEAGIVVDGKEYPASKVLVPIEEFMAEESIGQGLIYGRAKIERRNESFTVNFSRSDKAGRWVTAIFKPTHVRYQNKERLIESFKKLKPGNTDVVIWWRGFNPTPPTDGRVMRLWIKNCLYPAIKFD